MTPDRPRPTAQPERDYEKEGYVRCRCGITAGEHWHGTLPPPPPPHAPSGEPELHTVRYIAELGHHRQGCPANEHEPLHHACFITAGGAVERIRLPSYEALRAALAQRDQTIAVAREFLDSHQCEAEALCGGCREMYEALDAASRARGETAQD